MAINRSITFGSPPTYPGSFLLPLGDNLTVLDALSYSRGYNRALAESLGITDAATFSKGSSGTYPTDDTTNGYRSSMGSLTSMSSTTISSDGTVVNLRNVTGPLGVNAANVTIRQSVITGGFYAIDATANADNLLIEDCTITGATTGGVLFDGLNGITIRRCNIYGCEDGIKGSGDNILIEDCYLHDPLVQGADPHNDGIQIQGANHFTLQRNMIKWVDTGCLSMFQGQGIVDDALIQNNYFGSKGTASPNLVGWLLSLAGTGGTNIRVLNNDFGNWLYGPATDWTGGNTGNAWSGNKRASDASAPSSPAPGAAVNP